MYSRCGISSDHTINVCKNTLTDTSQFLTFRVAAFTAAEDFFCVLWLESEIATRLGLLVGLD